MINPTIINLTNIWKSLGKNESYVEIIKNQSLSIQKGEFVLVMGPSGSGKSTLLSLIGGLDSVDKGVIRVNESNLHQMSQSELRKFRRDSIGFVFQFYGLISSLNVLENVEIVLELTGLEKSNTLDILTSVGLIKRITNYPSQLSGGEKQRAAIARALAKNPVILLCDEPTGQLDQKTGKEIVNLIHKISKIHSITTIMVSHDLSFKWLADRIITIQDGRLTEN